MKILAFLCCFVLASDLFSQQKREYDEFYFGDTIKVDNPIVVSSEFGCNIVLLNVKDIKDVIAVIDTLHPKKSLRKIKNKFSHLKFYHMVVAFGILLDNGFVDFRPVPINDDAIHTVRIGKFYLYQWPPCNMLEFFYLKKAEAKSTSPNPFNRKHFLLGYTKYGVLY